jgi:thiaminase/transcriptional activator TenA
MTNSGPSLPPEQRLAPTFCQLAWARTATLRQSIYDHPFLRSLATGELAEQKFVFYVAQDLRYLSACSRALAAASTGAPDARAREFFALHAQEAAMEQVRHRTRLSGLTHGLDWADALATSAACNAYMAFLESTARDQSWPTLIAALLPCFWVYHDVALRVRAQAPDLGSHPYRTWIQSYSGAEGTGWVQAACEIADEAASAVPAEVIGRMLDAFARSTEFEWRLWESAWRLEI